MSTVEILSHQLVGLGQRAQWKNIL